MTLKTALQNLLESPAFADGQVVTSRLTKGLTVKLKQQDDQVMVQLSRDGALPSMAEWKSVLDCWPEQATVVEEPRELKPQGKRQFLRGKLRQSPRLVE